MILNASTGLPEVPKGYFWRVKKSLHPYGYVQLRKKLFIGSFLVESTIFRQNELSERTILSDAWLTLNKVDFNPKPKKNFYGNYPPKTIGEIK